jgi:hypothetical protein
MKIKLLAALIIVGVPGIAAAQDIPVHASAEIDSIQIIKMMDGSVLIGHVTQTRDDSVRVRTGGGEMSLAKSQIKSMQNEPATRMHDGEYWFANPNRSRLFFGPSAEMLKKGEGYISDFELFLVGGSYGVTDNITIGGGTIVPGTTDVFFLTPKIGFSPKPNVHLATGVLMFGSWKTDDRVGVYYGAATIGSSEGNVTAGIGYGFDGADVVSKPVFMLGGEKRVSRRVALVTENYFVSGVDPLIGGGFRFLGEKISADLGFLHVQSDGDGLTIPLVNFVAKF